MLRYLKIKHPYKYLSISDLEEIAEKEGLNTAFINFEAIQSLKGVYEGGVK